MNILGIGLTGRTLTGLERKILSETSPYAVVLFGRNIGDPEQLRALVAEVKRAAARPPLFMIDQEGGRVDRLRNLIPGLPGAEGVAEGERPSEMAAWLGRVTGMALRWFDVECDLAPVVDIRGDVQARGLERRTFGPDPETVTALAGAFLHAMQREGVAGCLKHWPGIGSGSADPHYGATVIDAPYEQLRARDLVPFERLGRQAGAIMIGHGTYPRIEDDPDLPATLSRRLTTELLRDDLGFDGLAISDDMEMHAVSDLGSYEDICERALMAGNDAILFCSHIERVPDIARHLEARAAADTAVRARLDEAVRRCEAYRAHCETLRAASEPPASFAAVVEEAARFVDAWRASRPEGEGVVPVERRQGERAPGKGRTGREEWT